jgi:hypothetical protein
MTSKTFIVLHSYKGDGPDSFQESSAAKVPTVGKAANSREAVLGLVGQSTSDLQCHRVFLLLRPSATNVQCSAFRKASSASLQGVGPICIMKKASTANFSRTTAVRSSHTV